MPQAAGSLNARRRPHHTPKIIHRDGVRLPAGLVCSSPGCIRNRAIKMLPQSKPERRRSQEEEVHFTLCGGVVTDRYERNTQVEVPFRAEATLARRGLEQLDCLGKSLLAEKDHRQVGAGA